MNNELFVYVKKKPFIFITTRNQSLQDERVFMRVERKGFHFQPETCMPLNHSYLLPVLNLVK